MNYCRFMNSVGITKKGHKASPAQDERPEPRQPLASELVVIGEGLKFRSFKGIRVLIPNASQAELADEMYG